MTRSVVRVAALVGALLVLVISASTANAAAPLIIPVAPSDDPYAVASTTPIDNGGVPWFPGPAWTVKGYVINAGSWVYFSGDPYTKFPVVWEDVGSGQPISGVQGSNGFEFPFAGEYPYHCEALTNVNNCFLDPRRSKIWVIGPGPIMSIGPAEPSDASSPFLYTFDASDSFVTDFTAHNIVEYAFDYTSNGTWDQVGPDPTAEASFVPGSHAVTLRVKDDLGRTATAEFDFDVPDVSAPEITITTPADGATYKQGAAVTADYACDDEDGADDVALCDGTVADGAAIDTSTPGQHTFTVTSEDQSGNTASRTVHYTVQVPEVTPPAPSPVVAQGAATVPSSVPVPKQPRALDLPRSRAAASSALLRRYGSSWKRGKKKSLRCSKLANEVYECRASWRKGRRTYKRRVVVSVEGTTVRTRVRA